MKPFTGFDKRSCSGNVKLSDDGVRVDHIHESGEEDEYGVVFGNGPVPRFSSGLYFEVTIEKLRPGVTDDGLVMGITDVPWKNETWHLFIFLQMACRRRQMVAVAVALPSRRWLSSLLSSLCTYGHRCWTPLAGYSWVPLWITSFSHCCWTPFSGYQWVPLWIASFRHRCQTHLSGYLCVPLLIDVADPPSSVYV